MSTIKNMRAIFKLLIFCCLIFLYHCFVKPGFQVLTERTEVTHNNKEYMDVWMKTGRGNRTTIMSNCSIHVYQTIPATAVVTVIGYEFKSNEYRRSAVDISRYMCDYFNAEYALLFKRTMEKIGHVPDKCPLEKGHYYWTNFIMDSIYIPFKPIGERWMFEGNLTLDDKLLTRILWYIKIERYAEFWSH